jgi:hypothetical protein
MRLLRVRFTIRRMMIVVLVVALACGWVARQPRRQGLLAAARAQVEVTNDFISKQAFSGPNSEGHSHVEFLDSSPDRLRWVWRYRAWSNSDGARLIDVEVAGGFDGSDLGPIVIKDRGGTRNARTIKFMTHAYGRRGWWYDVISPRAPDPADSHLIGKADAAPTPARVTLPDSAHRAQFQQRDDAKGIDR